MRSYRRGPMIPAGVQMPYGGDAPPAGWLLLDGAAVSRAAYPRLYAVLGDAYGAGDGSTTFNVPDKRGRVSIGVDASHAKGVKSGSDTNTPSVNNHTLSTSQIASHAHTQRGRSSAGSSNAGLSRIIDGGSLSNVDTTTSSGSSSSHGHNTDPLDVHQPEEADNWIIKF